MRTIARVYDTYAQARRVVEDLEAAGAPPSDINLIANRSACEESVRAEQQSESEAYVYCEAVRRGGTMVSMRTSEADEQRVLRVMDQHRPVDYVARDADYRKAGWQRFDPEAGPYTLDQTEIDRLRRPYAP